MEYKVYVDDCRKVIGNQIKWADYVFGIPPDFAGLELDPAKPKERQEYWGFLNAVMAKLTTITECITMGVTDRKSGGVVFPKHAHLIWFFAKAKWHFKSHKIWIKKRSIDVFRMTYSHFLTFTKTPTIPNGKLAKEFRHDTLHHPEEQYGNFREGLTPIKLTEIYIRRHTNERQTVYDPFCGTCTAAVAAALNGRGFVGSDPSHEYAGIALRRFNEAKSNLFAPKGIEDLRLKIITNRTKGTYRRL